VAAPETPENEWKIENGKLKMSVFSVVFPDAVPP
jgi:hypothetical protein